MKKVTLYTDGSTDKNPGPGGWAAILLYQDEYGELHERVLSGRYEHTTSGRMEIIGVIRGIEALIESCDITVISDSEYVVNTINLWLETWIKKDFQNKKNVDLWKQYLEVSKNHKVKASWTRGHAQDVYNNRCDKLAQTNQHTPLVDEEYVKQ